MVPSWGPPLVVCSLQALSAPWLTSLYLEVWCRAIKKSRDGALLHTGGAQSRLLRQNTDSGPLPTGPCISWARGLLREANLPQRLMGDLSHVGQLLGMLKGLSEAVAFQSWSPTCPAGSWDKAEEEHRAQYQHLLPEPGIDPKEKTEMRMCSGASSPSSFMTRSCRQAKCLTEQDSSMNDGTQAATEPFLEDL